MAYVKATGVVLKRTKVGDNDAILTIFTDSLGVIKASAKGIKSLKNKSFAGATLFSFSEFVLRPARDMYYLVSAELKVSFYNLSTNIERLAFATYIADITGYVFLENDPEPEALKLLLNTFYLLANSSGELRQVKCVYELKLLYYCGVGMHTESCLGCAKKEELLYFTLSGGVLCPDCRKNFPDFLAVSKNCVSALSYIMAAEDKKAFSFKVSEKVLDELEYITESFFKKHVDKDFYSLSYLNTILGKDKPL